MATLKDIARSIASSHNMKGREAENFVAAIVETIMDGLENDRLVKIKGFGTFKITAVRDRESVNVNTGERVVISGHDKISFTPDNALRDLVNKPFAHFETVVLDDNVDMEAITAVPNEPEEVVQQADAMASSLAAPVLEGENKSAVAEVSRPVVIMEMSEPPVKETPRPVVVMEMPEPVVETEPKVVSEELSMPENVDVSVDEDVPESNSIESSEEKVIEQEEETSCRISLLSSIIISVFVGAVCFLGGVLLSDYDMLHLIQLDATKSVPEQPIVKQKVKNTIVAPKVVVSKASQENGHDSIEVKKENVAVDVKQVPESKPTENKSKEEKMEPKALDYSFDARVRTGAYNIVGVSEIVTVKRGQTLASISKSYLGAGMECYIEAFNGVKEVKEGDKLKIPKLQLKRAKKISN